MLFGDLRGKWRYIAENTLNNMMNPLTVSRTLSRQNFIQHRAEAVDICARIDIRILVDLFGRYVVHAALHLALPSQANITDIWRVNIYLFNRRAIRVPNFG